MSADVAGIDRELSALVAECIDGSADADRIALLESRLLADAEARRKYLDAALLDAALTEHFSAAGLTGMVDMLAPGGEVAPPRRPGPRPFSLTAAALLLTLVVGGLGGALAAWQAVRAAAGLSPAGTFAEISRTRLAVPGRKHVGGPIEKGRSVGRGRLALESGAIEVAFRSGAMVVLEGPAEIELAGDGLAFLHQGVAVVRTVSGAGRLDLETPTAHVAGGGAEFAARVEPSLTTDVQVYSGEVVATGVAKAGSGQFPRRIAAGEAVRFSSQPDASPERIAFSAERFTRRVPDDRGIGLGARRRGVAFGRPRLDALVVTRADGPVVVDGRLDDWPAAPAFTAIGHGTGDGREGVEGWMMHDDDRLYVAARVADPLPMRNSVDPDLDAALAWRGGGLQLFFSADRGVGWPADANSPSYYENRDIEPPLAERLKAENQRLMTLIMTHHAPTKTDRLFVGRGTASYAPRPLQPGDYEGRIVAAPDGRGYTLEYAIPWTTLGVDDDPPRSGDALAVGWQVHFSDESGKLWRDQIVEIRNGSEPADIYLFERAATWGRAEFR